MKRIVVTVAYHHYVVSPETAVNFLVEAQEVDREYDDGVGYVYTLKKPRDRHEIELKLVDSSEIKPYVEAPEGDKP